MEAGALLIAQFKIHDNCDKIKWDNYVQLLSLLLLLPFHDGFHNTAFGDWELDKFCYVQGLLVLQRALLISIWRKMVSHEEGVAKKTHIIINTISSPAIGVQVIRQDNNSWKVNLRVYDQNLSLIWLSKLQGHSVLQQQISELLQPHPRNLTLDIWYCSQVFHRVAKLHENLVWDFF